VDTDFAGAGDWDNGIGGLRDGSYSPKADEGVRTVGLSGMGGAVSGDSDYFYAGGSLTGLAGFFSPNRQVPSAAIYGNLPTGTWRTLLFRPDRTYHRGANPTVPHFGSTTPPDMYLLDFFHMPLVEPYAISEPFSTAGKINMNAQMIPFSSYITRETGLRAVLASTRLTAYNSAVNLAGLSPPTTVGGMCNSAGATPPDVQTRFPLNLDETIKGFQERYDGTDATGRRVFVSPAEICSIDLVPNTSGITKSNLASFWANNLTTGDNSRERPYAHLLPRLTTRSNSYTVHVTAQALAPGPGAAGWQARASAQSRRYAYVLRQSEVRPTLEAGRVGWSFRQLDGPAMRRAADYLLGEHDFSSFRASECQALSPVKNLLRIDEQDTRRDAGSGNGEIEAHRRFSIADECCRSPFFNFDGQPYF
jgi:uncharacterized protein (TIGR02600 family)